MTSRAALALLLALLWLPVACGDDDGDADRPVIVRGHLIAVDGEPPILCLGAILESAPPQCGGESLTVVGVDPLEVPGVEQFMGWASGDVELTGTVEDGVLTVTP